MHSSPLLLATLSGGLLASAHSFVSNININGLSYDGWRPTNPAGTPDAVGWSTEAFDHGYVNQSAYQTEEIICHRGAVNARGHAPVAAGDSVQLQWNGWPESHKGPVIDYLARCGDESCATVDKLSLEFFKISQLGLLDGTEAPGQWASDQLIANNNSWVVEIPKDIKPGFYVLRTEIVALHNASVPLGAQNYPQCLNLKISGNGDILPAGIPAQAFYSPEDVSFHLDIYAGVTDYTIPGPAVAISGEPVTLSHPLPTATGTAIVVTDSPASTLPTNAATPSNKS
jgi:cellulase